MGVMVRLLVATHPTRSAIALLSSLIFAASSLPSRLAIPLVLGSQGEYVEQFFQVKIEGHSKTRSRQ
jgi:hypothetical protein